MRDPFLVAPEIIEQSGHDCLVDIWSCLKKDPKQRPSAAELLRHPFVRTPTKNSFLIELIEMTSSLALIR